MSKHGVSEQELDGLSPAERAALEDEEGAESKDDKDEAADEAKADASEDGKVEEEKEETVDEPAGEAEEDEPFAVPFHHQAKAVDSKAIETDLSALKKQYDDGHLDIDQFLAKRDEILEPLRRDAVKAEIAEQSQDQVALALWQRARDDFMDAHPLYKGDAVLYAALDSEVKRLAADKANDGLSDKRLIDKAHEEVAKRFKVDAGDTPKDAKKTLADKRKVDRSEVPRTLAETPAAAEVDAVDNEFANLEKLLEAGDTAAYERALAKLSPEQEARYLRGTVGA